MPSIPYPWTVITTDTDYRIGPMGPQGPPADETKIRELQDRINALEKKLNDFIDNPEKVRELKKVDPYGEENWE